MLFFLYEILRNHMFTPEKNSLSTGGYDLNIKQQLLQNYNQGKLSITE